MRQYPNNIAAITFLCAVSTGIAQPAAKNHSVYNAFWSASDGLHAIAQLHNNLVSEPLVVTTVIYSSGGERVALDPVHLVALGNAQIDISEELTKKGRGNLASGSAAFEYQHDFPGALGAEIFVANNAKSLSFTVPSTENPTGVAAQHAVFWLPSNKAEIYVAVQNTADQPIRVSPSVTMNGRNVQAAPIALAARGSSVFSISKYLKNNGPWQRDGVGAIMLVHDGPPGALNTGAWVEDDIGYSNTLTFGGQGSAGTTLYGTQILVGRAGNAFDLPGSFAVSSTLVMRNMSDQALKVEGELVFSDAGTIAKASIPPVRLAAGDVASVDLDRIKADAGISPSFVSASISLNYSGPGGAVLARVFGITDDSDYAFYWALQGNPGGWSYSESFWTTEGNWVPLLTVANFGAKADRVAVTLTSNSGMYTMEPLTLQAGESRTINIRDVLTNARPFSPQMNFGGFAIRGASVDSRILVKEHLIDPQSRLATPFYGQPVYCTHYDFDAASYTAGVGTTASANAIAYWSDSTSGPAGNSFSSDNTSTATISGAFGFGTITGVAGGTTTVRNQINAQYDIQGDVQTFYAQAPVKVMGYVQVSLTSVAGAITHGVSGSCTTATVQVFVSRGSLSSNPNVTVQLSKYSSNPAGINVDISTLSSNPLTITSSSADFTFNVCNGANNSTGTVTLQAVITGATPTSDFTIKDPNPPGNAQAALTIN